MAVVDETTEPEPEPEPEPDVPLEGPEHELEEGDDGTEPDADEPTVEHVPASETVLIERQKKLATETRRHENAVRKIYGDDFDQLAVCPLCLTDGYVIPAPPGAFPPEQWEAVQLAAGMLAEENYKTADYAETCPTCDGYGQVLSGSKTDTQRLIPCRPCESKGWKAKLDAPQPAPVFTLPTAPPANGTANLDWAGPKDQWGRPAGHPQFGMDPALVGLTGA